MFNIFFRRIFMDTSNYSTQQQQYFNNQNSETLLSMRKHHSSDNDQFLLAHNLSPNFSLSSAPTNMPFKTNFGGQLDSSSQNNYYKNWYNQQQQQKYTTQRSLLNSMEEENNIAWTFQPISAQSFLNEVSFSVFFIKELLTICDQYNNLISSIHSFWVPKLQYERKQKDEEKIKAENLERQLVQLESEVSILRSNSNKNDENSGAIRSHSSTNLRDFTDHSITLSEWKTLKAKLEQSELCLSECSRELQNVELKAKCLEEEKKEVEKRNEILTHCSTNNEEQLKLINEDLNVLRNKLELKNQLLENREKIIKKLEDEKEKLKLELKEDKKCVNETEHRSSQLLHKIDLMERLQKEKDAQIEQLKQKIQQQPGTRAEKQLEEKIENLIEERNKLEQILEQIQKQNDIELQKQLEMFILEREQLQLDIIYLKKELADRHMLIGSQSEKISQFEINNFVKNKNEEINEIKKEEEENLKELHHKEIDCLLARIGLLEKEKSELLKVVKLEGGNNFSGINASSKIDLHKLSFLSERNNELEGENKNEKIILFKKEALKESVECTTEKEKELNEQKKLNKKLGEQVNKLFEFNLNEGKRGEENSLIKNSSDTKLVVETQKLLEEEKKFRQQQISSLRKEFGMALIAEKESTISLILNICPPSSIDSIPGLCEKLEILQKQKEAIKHSLLIEEGGQNSEGKKINLQQQKKPFKNVNLVGHNTKLFPFPSSSILPGRPISSLSSIIPYTQPIKIQTNTNNELLFNKFNNNNNEFGGMSAPATFNFEDFNNQILDEEGIWA
ncbi:hypothetical protein Mgra_00000777 [Meloidogyne graminicola]|uniref:Uncharacterized protein n=1 Tax=Meloidogyne graminicola TaxID=189291 RepID=A0A8T0A217_9BILA|nr:hypothetical protein Mgra_00000777 [Meloidogyne graminicola]